jgi:hypothetical protein
VFARGVGCCHSGPKFSVHLAGGVSVARCGRSESLGRGAGRFALLTLSADPPTLAPVRRRKVGVPARRGVSYVHISDGLVLTSHAQPSPVNPLCRRRVRRRATCVRAPLSTATALRAGSGLIRPRFVGRRCYPGQPGCGRPRRARRLAGTPGDSMDVVAQLPVGCVHRAWSWRTGERCGDQDAYPNPDATVSAETVVVVVTHVPAANRTGRETTCEHARRTALPGLR